MASRYLSVISTYKSPIAVFIKGFFQLRVGKSYSQHYSQTYLHYQFHGAKKQCMLLTALGLPQKMSHHSVLTMKFQGFSQVLLLRC